jgi:hypothetical protein
VRARIHAWYVGALRDRHVRHVHRRRRAVRGQVVVVVVVVLGDATLGWRRGTLGVPADRLAAELGFHLLQEPALLVGDGLHVACDLGLELAKIDIDVELDVYGPLLPGARTEALLGLLQVALVGAVLDGAAGAVPELLVRAQLLRDDGEAKPKRGVAYLLTAQHLHPALDVLAGHLRLELLVAKEVLVIELTEPLEAGIQLTNHGFHFFLIQCHCFGPRALRLTSEITASITARPP